MPWKSFDSLNVQLPKNTDILVRKRMLVARNYKREIVNTAYLNELGLDSAKSTRGCNYYWDDYMIVEDL